MSDQSGVQKFVNQNQYKLMVGLFLVGMFFAKTEFMQKAFDVFKKETEEELKILTDTDEYNIERVKRMLAHSELETQLKVDIKLLKLELKECKTALNEGDHKQIN